MKALVKKLVESKAGYSTLALRIPVGIIFMAHKSYLAGLVVMVWKGQGSGWHPLDLVLVC